MTDVEELVKKNSEKVQRLINEDINEKLEQIVADSEANIEPLKEKLSKLEIT